jgi:hypothetical protein
MHEVPPDGFKRHHLLDGGYALLLLTFAIANGYWLLAPPSLRARPLPVVAIAVPSAPREMTDAALGRTEPPAPAARIAPTPEREAPPRRDTDRPGRRPVAAPPITPAPPAEPPVPWPGRVSGRVVDADRKPVAGAFVAAGSREIKTDAEGRFALEPLPAGARVVVKLPGYARVVVPPPGPPNGEIEAVLKPLAVKAAYLTYFGVAHPGIRGKVDELLARTELNAVVIDVKGDRGWIPYRTEVPQALAAGAQGPVILRNFEGLIADYRARGVYTIARIVTFKDNVLANHRPDLAVIDTRTGKPWIDNERLAWVDPFREEVWRYNIEIAKEAASKGFDEIQFDYVRFPTDGRLAAAKYAKPVNKETRLPAVAAFLERARRELGPHGVFVAADVFGYTAFNENDTDIGQRVEELVPHLDFICPMVYPSGYHVGIPGFRNPVVHAYEVVHESVRLIRKRSGSLPVRVRPWLQDFKDYAFDRRIFGVTEIRAQIKGSDDAGGSGWMLWNPRNDYTGAALRARANQ